MSRLEKPPLVDDRLPHPFRELYKELRAMRVLLEEIKETLVAVPPPAVPPAVPALPPGIPPAITIRPVLSLSGKEFVDVLVKARVQYAALKRANDLYVETIDLATARAKPTEIPELAPIGALALTIFRNTGTFDMYLQKRDDNHKLTFDALTYPQTFLLDWFDLKKVYIKNTAQTGQSAKIIVWKRM